jgi:Protein of unknown function (DUF3089)
VGRTRAAQPLVLCVLLSVLAAATAACTDHARPAASTTPPPTTAAPDPPPTPADSTVWLCRPGTQPDPCTSDRTATVIDVSGSRRRERPRSDGQPVDCFYVYPTVSKETTRNADLTVQPEETAAAVAQASRFSQVCRVWAPMYRQRTLTDLFNLADGWTNSTPNRVAYASLLGAWQDYLAHDNDGRRVVLIGHSQGAAMLIRLLRAQVDPDPSVRRRVVLAILLGANVTVPTGKLVGGSFAHLPLCTRPAESGCVIAYSSFPSQPPRLALFGRPGVGVSALSGETRKAGLSVACVNPDGLGAGTHPLHPYVPSADLPVDGVTTPWVGATGRYTATCKHGGGASWLEVVPTPGVADPKALLSQSLGPAWGYHTVDVTIALGDLVADVRDAANGPTS